MNINIKLDKNFTTAFNKLISEGGRELAVLNGFAEEQLSYTDFIDHFIDKNVADTSIDGNSNVRAKDICTLLNEMSKPHLKLLTFNKIFYELNKKYDYKTACDWLEAEWNGKFYLHDGNSSSQLSYCYAYDLEQLVNKGLYFIQNFNAQPPKHLTTYTDFVGEFVSWTSNRTSGACGLPSFLIYSFYFWKKDCEQGYFIQSPEYYRDQEFQRIIYKLNQPYLRVTQTAFTNFSIFDKSYLVELFGGKEFPDGTFMIDYVDEMIEYQKAFMHIVDKIRNSNMMTFPVLTFALLKENGSWAHEDFAKWCCEHNMKWADSNFFVSPNVTSLSNCCLSADEKVISKVENGFYYGPISDLYKRDYRDNISAYYDGEWRKAKVVKLPNKQMYKLSFENGKTVVLTEDHLNPTNQGDKETRELVVGDKLLYHHEFMNGEEECDSCFPFNDLNDSTNFGVSVGMFVSCGRFEEEEIVYVIPNSKKSSKLINDVCDFVAVIDEEYSVDIEEEDENTTLTISSDAFVNEIKKQIMKINRKTVVDLNCLDYNSFFRNGIVIGCLLGKDTISYDDEDIVGILDVICQSVARKTKLFVEEKEGKKIYTLKVEEPDPEENCYVKITSIEKVNDTRSVYCFEMYDQSKPYFMLPSGLITHNCRLLSDIEELGYFNSIGGSGLEVGSVKVNTINLSRIAYEVPKEEYLSVLAERVVLDLKALDTVRSIIKRNVEKGLLPNYDLGIINMDSQYNTIGVIGIYETLQKYDLIKKDKFGYVFYTEEGLEFAKNILEEINKVKTEFAKKVNYKINIEQVPAERAAYVLMQKDKLFFPNEEYELPLYGNQWIPLSVKTTLSEKVRISSVLDRACNGGSISHINISAPFTNFEQAWKMLNYVADAGITYFAFNLKISSCVNNHAFFGETCPECGLPKETSYSRVVGFLVPERNFSKERKAEFVLRDWMDLN